MREDYLRQAQKIISDPNILINVVSRRVKQLKYGARPTVESLEKLSLEDIALLEVIRGNIKYELYEAPGKSKTDARGGRRVLRSRHEPRHK